MITGQRACQLLRADYTGQLVSAVQPYDEWGVTASLVFEEKVGNILIIRGTDEPSDWWRYNLRAWPAAGDTHWFHRGFLDVARKVEAWAHGLRAAGQSIHAVAGHSKGAAAAQILSLPSSLDLKGWGFGSPRPVYHWGQDIERPGFKHVIHEHDPVGKRLRRFAGGAWIGEVRICAGFEHKITAYEETCKRFGI